MQSSHGNDRAGRPVRAQYLGVRGIHLGPVRHVGDVDGHGEQVIEVAAGRAQYRLDVAESALRLVFDRAVRGIGPGRIERKLAGDIDDASMHDRLRVVPRGRGASGV